MTGIRVRFLGIRITIFIICFYIVSSFSVRLRGGSTTSGRLDVNFDDGSGWGTVCDDSWDEDDARVACRSLGLPSMFAIPITNARFGAGTGDTLMDNVACVGNEPSLRYCPYVNKTEEDCSHSEDAGVVCWTPSFKYYNHLYLSNSYSPLNNPLDGIVMLNYTNKEYVVGICSDQFRDEEAQVACFELGFERNSSHVLRYDTYGKLKAFFLWISFKCDGTERRLSSCRKTQFYGMCPNKLSGNPSIVCNYRPVRALQLYGNVVSQSWISMDYNKEYTIYCDTDLARPNTKVSWVINNKFQGYGSRNSTDVSGSLYRTKSSLKIFASDSLHGKNIKCCSDDPIGYKICSSNFIINVTVYPTIKTTAIYHIKRDITNKTGDIFACISQRSRPEPTIDWYHNGIQMKDSRMLEAKTQLLNDGTYRKTSTIIFPFNEIFTGSNIVECKLSIENHLNVISVPYFIQRDGGIKDTQSINDEKKANTGNIIIYICFSGVILILSVAILCMSLFFRRRNLDSDGADRTRSAGRDYTPRENEAYTGAQYELENYEQLSPTPGGSLGKIGESVYENTRTS